MASPTRRAWVWVDSGGLWWTGRPGVLWFMGSQRVGHDWATELNWTELMLMYYAFTPDSVLKSVPPNGSEPLDKPVCYTQYIVPLNYVNEIICMVICLSTRFKSIILWPRMTLLVPRLSQNTSYGWGAWCHSLSFKTFLSFISRLLVAIWSEVAQLCLTLCDPMDCSLPRSSVHGIFQAGVLQWVAISFSRASSRPRDWTRVSHIISRCFTVWATREVL